MSDRSAIGPVESSRDAWQAAIDFGLDVSGIDDRLALTPAERLRRHDRAVALVRVLRQAGIRYYGFDPRTPEEPQVYTCPAE
jgi:hypothetical protein